MISRKINVSGPNSVADVSAAKTSSFLLIRPVYGNDWFLSFNTCTSDNFALKEMYNNCGASLSSIVPTTISIPKGDVYYGRPNIYCRWQIMTQFPNVAIVFDKMVQMIGDYHTLQIIYNRKETEILELTQTSFTLIREDVNMIYFHYSSPHNKLQQPFLLSVIINAEQVDYMYLVIFIVISVTSCFVCTCVFYRCSKMIINKNQQQINEIERARIAANNAFDAATNREMVADSNEKKLELIENKLKPDLYDSKMNEYGSNCTICLEDFKANDKICVLECKHLFHEACIRDYFRKNLNSLKCPNCNKELQDSMDSVHVEENHVVPFRGNPNNQLNNFISTERSRLPQAPEMRRLSRLLGSRFVL